MDYLGKEYSNESMQESMKAHLSNLKIINVPTMFDIGCTQADPQTEYMSLSMLDSITLNIIKENFLSEDSDR